MSRITSFAIESLAGRVGLSSGRLRNHINVFYGPNGCGKTTLLSLFHLALLEKEEGLERLAFGHAEIQIEVFKAGQLIRRCTHGPHPSRRSAEHSMGKETVRQDRPTNRGLSRERLSIIGWQSSELDGPGTSLSAEARKIQHRFLPTSRVSDDYGARSLRAMMRSEREDAAHSVELLFVNQLMASWESYHRRMLEETSKAQEKGLARILAGVLLPSNTPSDHATAVSEELANAAYLSVVQFLDRQGSGHAELGTQSEFVQRLHRDPSLLRVVSDIVQTEREISEATRQKHQLEQIISELYGDDKRLILDDERVIVVDRHQRRIPLRGLSSGERNLIRILLECILADEGPLIIDEPELSLHIDWQRRLPEMLSTLSPKAQVILATHSPEIMSSLDDSSIFPL